MTGALPATTLTSTTLYNASRVTVTLTALLIQAVISTGGPVTVGLMSRETNVMSARKVSMASTRLENVYLASATQRAHLHTNVMPSMGNVNVMLGTVLLTQELVKAAPVEVTSKMGSVFPVDVTPRAHTAICVLLTALASVLIMCSPLLGASVTSASPTTTLLGLVVSPVGVIAVELQTAALSVTLTPASALVLRSAACSSWTPGGVSLAVLTSGTTVLSVVIVGVTRMVPVVSSVTSTLASVPVWREPTASPVTLAWMVTLI